MHERLLIQLWENGRRLNVDAASRVGVVLRNERDAFPRRANIGLAPRDEQTTRRVRRLAQLKGWARQEWRLNIWADRGRLALAGSEADGLPPGRYKVTVGIEDLTVVGRRTVNFDIRERRDLEHSVEVRRDPRLVEVVDLAPDARRVLDADASVLDQRRAMEWLTSRHPRAVRQACLLNILAMARVTPTTAGHLLSHVRDVFFAATDRIYATAEPSLLQRLVTLSDGPRTKFHKEGSPTGGVHAALLFRIEDDRRVQPGTYQLMSFRAKGKPSLQAVVAYPKDGVTGIHHYVDLDLDLGNPLEDVVGFLIHMGELLNPGRTDHFKLFKTLKQGKAGEFLGYRIA